MRLHPEVPHPRTLKLRGDLARYERGLRGKVAAVNDYLAVHLAVVFGLAWTVWVFMTVTVAAYWMPASIQSKIFFFSSGCIQLFALPLLTYIGNKAQKATDLQSDAFHQALTHIAIVEDQNNQLIQAVHVLLQENTTMTEMVKDILDNNNKSPQS